VDLRGRSRGGEVGTATVPFANGNAATFTFTVNDGGKTHDADQVDHAQVFRAPGTVCG
jgi:nitrous oxide reductase accessory protein NosL